MDDNIGDPFRERFYLPCEQNDVNSREYLSSYIEREFPGYDQLNNNNVQSNNKQAKVYSVPPVFKKGGEKQASLAEEVVFQRLHGLKNSSSCPGLWMTFFHSACYAGHSSRNERFGKLMIREHDFVVFAKCHDQFFAVLIEVKSTNDANTSVENVNVTSDAKVIKNNKRSAQHQLRDHMEVLEGALGLKLDKNVQCYVMWPFLGAYTRDPRQALIKRWKEDHNLHVFEDTLSDQEKFGRWFLENVLASIVSLDEELFAALLNRYVTLSCAIFVDEIEDRMLALLTQEQLELLRNDYCQRNRGKPLVVHGAAGTGKTMLIVKKLQQLHAEGKLNEENRALYICYWPGIRCDVHQKLQELGIADYVDSARFYISQTGFLGRNRRQYRHIFMDEAEAICLSFEEEIIRKTLNKIFERYHAGNCSKNPCKSLDSEEPFYQQHFCESSSGWGELWLLVDINQASLFLPKHSPAVLKKPQAMLSKVMRSTGNVFRMFKQYYADPIPNLPVKPFLHIPDIGLGHHINGPPIYWVSAPGDVQLSLVQVVIDLCATKGFKPNDLCVIPFLVNDKFLPDSINEELGKHFVANGYRPRAVGDVERFLQRREVNDFLVAWALRVKGLEFKVVLAVFDEGDFESADFEDRKRAYIIASRATCLLVFVGSPDVRHAFGQGFVSTEYPFNLSFPNISSDS